MAIPLPQYGLSIHNCFSKRLSFTTPPSPLTITCSAGGAELDGSENKTARLLNFNRIKGVASGSCTNVKIEDVCIVSGDDCIAVKSGWDEYGIKVGMPSQHIIIRRLTCISPDSAMTALGSEMSGGIQDIRAEDNVAINTQSAVRVKIAVGRGAYLKDIFVKEMKLNTYLYKIL